MLLKIRPLHSLGTVVWNKDEKKKGARH